MLATPPKIIFFDIDDTLYIKHQDRVPKSVFLALNALKQQGILLAIATGRAMPIFPKAIQQLIQDIGIDIFVTINGQYVSANGQCIAQFPLPPTVVQQITDYFHQHNIAYGLMSNQQICISHHTPEVQSAMESLHLPFQYLTENMLVDEDIYQILAFYRATQHTAQLGEQFKVVRWHETAVDVLEQGSSKIKGIQAVLDHLGLDWSQTMAFGDGLNDMEMIQKVGYGVAMGNAQPALKQVADFVTYPHEADGIYHAVAKLIRFA